MKKKLVFLFLVCLLVLVVTVQCGGNATTPTSSSSAPISNTAAAPANPTSSSGSGTSPTQVQASFDGPTLLQQKCTSCHSLDRVTNSHFTTAQWTQVIDQMIGNGAQLTTDERNFLINYLAQTYK